MAHELELKKKAEHEKEEEMAHEKELMELVRQETWDQLIKEKEEHVKSHVVQKYGHSIEMQLRKELDMEIPELTVETDTSAHVSLKWPSSNVNIMTPQARSFS